MADVLTIKEAVQRSKAEGMPVSEYTLRRSSRADGFQSGVWGKRCCCTIPIWCDF